MGLEGEHGLGRARGTGDLACLADHRLMAEMNAVEIADRDDGPAGVIGEWAVLVEDPHPRRTIPGSREAG